MASPKSGPGSLPASVVQQYQPENVIALLDRASYLEGDIERTTDRRRRRQAELARDAAFLAYESATSKQQHAANVRALLQPFSAEASSNREEILALLGQGSSTAAGGQSPAQNSSAASSPRLGLRHARTAAASPAELPLPAAPPRDKAAAQAETRVAAFAAKGPDDAIGFEVDHDFAHRFIGGKPMRDAPVAEGDDEDDGLGFTGLHGSDDETDEGADVWGAGGDAVQTIGRRKAARPKGSDGKGSEHFQRQLHSILAPPPATTTYAHELAHIFNMLDSNNIILIATEEHEAPNQSAGTPAAELEYKNRLVVLSPTNGMRLRRHLDTPPGESHLVYTSHGWVVRQSLLSAILQGRVDFEHVARLHQRVETTFFDLKRAEALLRKKDTELCRERKRTAYMQKNVEMLVSRSRLRRAFLVQLAFALKSAQEKADDDRASRAQPAGASSVRAHRNSYLADFIFRQDAAAEIDESAALGLPASTLGPPGPRNQFSSFEELQGAIAAYEEQKAKDPTAFEGFAAATTTDLDIGGTSMRLDPSLLTPMSGTAPNASLFSVAGAAGPNPDVLSMTQYTAVSGPVATSALGIQTHEALLMRLRQKLERATRRRNYEQRMELMERAAMEGEDCISAVNTVFKFGESGFARVRDILASIPKDLLSAVIKAGSALHHAPLAEEGTNVVCPCCKFEFDPSKPAADYREAILARQRKAREAVAAKQQAALAAQGSQKSGKGKSVNPGNMAGDGNGSTPTSTGKKKGKGAAGGDGGAPSEDTMYAVMALQETVDGLTSDLRAAEERCTQLDAEVEVARLNAATAQQRAATLTEELTAENDRLKNVAMDASMRLDASSRQLTQRENEVHQLQQKLIKLEKASEEAFEDLERRQVQDRRLGELRRVAMMEQGVKDGEAAWEDLARLYFRRHHEATTQLRKLGANPIETNDAYCGADAEMLTTVDRETQFNLVEAGIDVEEFFRDSAVQAVARQQEAAAQRTPRRVAAYAERSTQTSGIGMVMRPLLKSESQAQQRDDWQGADGENVHTVMMRRDIYNHLLKTSDYSDMMRAYIKELEARDKEDQERHAAEIAELTKKYSKEVKALTDEVKNKTAILETVRQQLAEKTAKLTEQTQLTHVLRSEMVNLRQQTAASISAAAAEAAASASTRERVVVKEVMVPTTVVVHEPAPAEPKQQEGSGDGSGVGSGGIETGVDADAFQPYEQIYRPTGVGRAIVRRVHARTTAELEEDEAAARRRMEELYAAFTIPLPMLLALLHQAKFEVRAMVEDGEARGRQREARMRQALHATRLLLGEDLGVSNEPPNWLDEGGHRMTSLAGAGVADGDLPAPGEARPLSYRVLQGREIAFPEQSRRDPVTGAYIKQRSHGGGGASSPSGAKLTVPDEAPRTVSPPPPAGATALGSGLPRTWPGHGGEHDGAGLGVGGGSILYKHGHVVQATAPEVVLAQLLRRISDELVDYHAADGRPARHGPHHTTVPRIADAIVVDGSELLPARGEDAGGDPRGLRGDADHSPAARRRVLDDLRQQRIADALAATRHLRALDHAVDVTGRRRMHDLPPLAPDGGEALGSARSNSPPPAPAVRSPTHAAGSPAKSETRAENVASLSLLMLRGRGPRHGSHGPADTAADAVDGSDVTPRPWSQSQEEAEEQNRAARRRVERLVQRGAADARRIRGIRANAASAPPGAGHLEMETIVGKPPVVGGTKPNHAPPPPRAHEPPVKPQDGGSAVRQVRDVLQLDHSAPLGLAHGITGAIRGSIAVRKPTSKLTKLSD